MALYHKWDVTNDFAYVLQFFSLIYDGLGGVYRDSPTLITVLVRSVAGLVWFTKLGNIRYILEIFSFSKAGQSQKNLVKFLVDLAKMNLVKRLAQLVKIPTVVILVKNS